MENGIQQDNCTNTLAPTILLRHTIHIPVKMSGCSVTHKTSLQGLLHDAGLESFLHFASMTTILPDVKTRAVVLDSRTQALSLPLCGGIELTPSVIIGACGVMSALEEVGIGLGRAQG